MYKCQNQWRTLMAFAENIFVIHSVPLRTWYRVSVSAILFVELFIKLWMWIYQLLNAKLNWKLQVFRDVILCCAVRAYRCFEDKSCHNFQELSDPTTNTKPAHSIISRENWTRRKISVDDANFARLLVLLKEVTTIRKLHGAESFLRS